MVKNRELMDNLQKYTNYLKSRNLSECTITNYQIAIRQYQTKYIGDLSKPPRSNKSLSTANLLTHTRQLLKKYEVASTQTKLAALKSFTKFNKIKADWERIIEILPKVQKKFFTTLTEEELEQLKAVRTETNEKI